MNSSSPTKIQINMAKQKSKEYDMQEDDVADTT
jgi:hypothetical protein